MDDVRLCRISAGYPRHPVLRDLDARLPGGRITALTGANGSGKSTLLDVLAGVLAPTGGTVSYPGSGPPAYVAQRSAVPDGLPITVRETVAMGRWGRRGGWRRLTAEDRAAVERSLDRLDLLALGRRRLGALSGGQRQRTLVAQGLAREADLLLLDEPCAGVDDESRNRIEAALAGERDLGRTVVLSTHDRRHALAADHCLVLEAGVLIAQGAPAAVLADGCAP